MVYSLTGQSSGTVRFVALENGTITAEGRSLSSKVTSNPIEDGSDINDHVVKDPEKFTVSGIVVGGASAEATLRAMWEKRDILSYSGRIRIDSVVLTSLSTSYSSKNRDGFSFQASFQKVKFTSAQSVPTGESAPMSQQDAGKFEGAAKTKSEGLTTTNSVLITADSYQKDYVNAFNQKPSASSGPAIRGTPSHNGIS